MQRVTVTSTSLFITYNFEYKDINSDYIVLVRIGPSVCGAVAVETLQNTAVAVRLRLRHCGCGAVAVADYPKSLRCGAVAVTVLRLQCGCGKRIQNHCGCGAVAVTELRLQCGCGKKVHNRADLCHVVMTI